MPYESTQMSHLNEGLPHEPAAFVIAHVAAVHARSRRARVVVELRVEADGPLRAEAQAAPRRCTFVVRNPVGTDIPFAAALPEPVDLRCGYDGLAALVRALGRQALYAGHLFVFVGRRAGRLKILFWDRGGFVVYCKPHRGRHRPSTVRRMSSDPASTWQNAFESIEVRRSPWRDVGIEGFCLNLVLLCVVSLRTDRHDPSRALSTLRCRMTVCVLQGRSGQGRSGRSDVDPRFTPT